MDDKKLPLSKLIELIGDENVQVQNLDVAITNVQAKQENTNSYHVTFVTDQFSPSDHIFNLGKVGLVLWIDRDKVEKVFDDFHKE